MIIEVNSDIKLNQLRQSDSLDIFNVINSQREYLGRWLPFVACTKDISDTEGFVDDIVNAEFEHFEYVFAIRKQNDFLGLIGFKDTERLNKRTEIGYWLSESYQRQGIMIQAVKKLCDFAFNNLGMNRIQIKCAVGNVRSSNIPQKLGFTLEGIEREGILLSDNVYADLQVYSLLKRDLK